MKAFSLLETLIVLFIFGIFIGVFGSSFLEIQKFKVLEDKNYLLTLQTKTSLQVLKNYLRLGIIESLNFTSNSLEFLTPLNDFVLIKGNSYPCFSGFLETIKLKNNHLKATLLAFPETLDKNICHTLFKTAKYALFIQKDKTKQNINKEAFRAEILSLDYKHITLNLPTIIANSLHNKEKAELYPKIYLFNNGSYIKIFLKENTLFLNSHQNQKILAQDIVSFEIKTNKLGFIITLCAKDNFNDYQKLCLSDILLFEEFSYAL